MAHSPDRPDVQARMGRCRFNEGRFEEARRLFESSVEKLPNDIPLLVDLAQLDLKEDLGGLDLAVAMVPPDNPDAIKITNNPAIQRKRCALILSSCIVVSSYVGVRQVHPGS